MAGELKANDCVWRLDGPGRSCRAREVPRCRLQRAMEGFEGHGEGVGVPGDDSGGAGMGMKGQWRGLKDPIISGLEVPDRD